MTHRVIRRPEVETLTGIPRSTLRRLRGDFQRQSKLVGDQLAG